MVIQHLENISDKTFRIIKQVSHRIAGRKKKRGHLDFDVNFKHTKHRSAFKDLADSDDKHQVIRWIKEDAHHRIEGGSLSDAFRTSIEQLHHTHNAARKALNPDPAFLRRTGQALKNIASTVGTTVDITADQFLSKVGLRKRRYTNAEVNDHTRLHARLAKMMYESHHTRSSVDGYSYVADRSDDNFGLFEKDGKRIIVGRGTDPASKSRLFAGGDLIHDVQIATGERMSDQNKLRHRIRGILDESDDHSVSLSGYSLAGGKMLNAALDDDIYSRLSDENLVISPGVSELDMDLRKLASRDKFTYSYSAHDGVSNALLQHAGDNHEINYDYKNLKAAHTEHIDNLAA